MKKIGEVFSDFNGKSIINHAEVENVTLRKRSKTLELKITSSEYIEVTEIEE